MGEGWLAVTTYPHLSFLRGVLLEGFLKAGLIGGYPSDD